MSVSVLGILKHQEKLWEQQAPMKLKQVPLNQYFEVAKSELVEFIDLIKPIGKKKLENSSLVFGVKNGRLYGDYADSKVSITGYFGAYGYENQYPVRVGYKDFSADLEKIDSGRVALHWDENRIYLDTQNTRHTSLIATDVTEFDRPIYEVKKFPSLAFLEALPAMIKIIDDDSPRNYGTVAMFHMKGSNFRVVATDSFSLALSNYAMGDTDYSFLNHVTLNRSQCQQLLIAAKSEHEISLGLSTDKTTLLLTYGTFTIYFRTSGIKYPNYKAVLPKEVRGSHFDVKQILRQARVNIEKRDKAKILRLEKTSLTDRPIVINPKYLIDALTATKSKTGRICIQASIIDPIKIILGSVETIIVPMDESRWK